MWSAHSKQPAIEKFLVNFASHRAGRIFIAMAVTKVISPRSKRVSYRARVRIKGYPDLSKTFARKTDALRWDAQTQTRVQQNKLPNIFRANKKTLTDVLPHYAEDIFQRLKDSHNRLKQLYYWEKAIGLIPLQELNPQQIKSILLDLANSKTYSTANRYLAALSAALTYATNELNWLHSNPCLKIRRFKEPRGRTRFLTDKELHQLICSCKALKRYPEILPIVLLAVTTGMRRGEILGLRWGQISFTQSRIELLETKNGDARSVPLVEPASSCLLNFSKEKSLKNENFVFPSRVDANTSGYFHLDHAWRLVKREANLEDFKFHDLRHTAASYLAMSGAGLREIGDILGQRNLSMTQRYSHLTQDHKISTVTRMVANHISGVL